jgi:hypothetical protein
MPTEHPLRNQTICNGIDRYGLADVNEEDENQDDLRRQHVISRVLDVNAGGLSALTDHLVPAGAKMCIDSTCTQPFPLGGIQCIAMQGSDANSSSALQLCFDQLPAAPPPRPGLSHT